MFLVTNIISKKYLFFCLLIISSCTNPNSHHKMMKGHWQLVSLITRAENPDYTSERDPSDFTPMDMYISNNAIYEVEQGTSPVNYSYEVIEEYTKDSSLYLCVKEGFCYTVYFTSGYKKMKWVRKQDPAKDAPPEITNLIREQMGMLIIESDYIRIDHKRIP